MARPAKCFLLAVFAAAALHAAEDAPDWVRQAAAQALPAFTAKVTSAVLLREEAVAVEEDGRRVMRERGVVKILQKGGEPIEARRPYNTKTGRVRDFQGWLIPPTGKPIPYAKNRIVDVALSREYVYDETRMKVLECGSAVPGSIFAWEVSDEERTSFTQDVFYFQHEDPVLVSRFILTLPAAWEARGVVLNGHAVEPQVSGGTYTWEMRDLPWLEEEAYSPDLALRAPRLGVSYYPPSDNRGGLQPLKDWPAVSVWMSRLVDPASEVTDAVRTKALQLTAKASGELEKIRAIAEFVQQTNYVEVALNLTRGGGYTPHLAAETLARNYGDCKDKAALMRGLLKAVGIDSYATIIYHGERHFVQPEWASPMQFNHAIVAVRLSNSANLPTVIAPPGLGNLLIFDPTDPFTPVGDLPGSEQGSYALIIAGGKGTLAKMPLLPATARRIESTVAATLDANGRVEAQVQREYYGQSGAGWRALAKLRGDDVVKQRLERNWSNRVGTATLDRVLTASHPEDNRFSVTLNLAADRFGQVMQNRILVVRPGLLAAAEYIFTSKQRSSPVELDTALRRDSIRIKIPPGFKLDELPAAAKIDAPFGVLDAKWTVQSGEILFEQTLEVRDVLTPAAEFAKVREFFNQVGGALSAPVVFVRQ